MVTKKGQWGGKRSRHRKRKRFPPTIAVCDFETDPFRGSAYPVYPFVAGFYDGSTYHEFWGSDCNRQLMEHIAALETKHIIYAHNGGRFDFNFVLDWISPEVFCIGTRIVRAYVPPANGEHDWDHELRDSYAAIPVSLARAANKLKFDYKKMLAHRRDKHRKEICEYLKQDCVELYGAIMLWRQKLGTGLTMAGAAMRKLDDAMSPFVARKKAALQMSEEQDARFRPYYFGGRVQPFEIGIVEPRGNSIVTFDITSSYPNVMQACRHPVTTGFKVGYELTENTDFATIVANSDGALPWRNSDTGRLDFPRGIREFHATGHEIRLGLKLGLIQIHRIVETLEAAERVDFKPFVEQFWNMRVLARKERDKHSEGSPAWIENEQYVLFWKLVLNGAYGKFAQNPREFKDVMICGPDDPAPDPKDGWQPAEIPLHIRQYAVYVRKLHQIAPHKTRRSFLNVATGASITGAARAALLAGIHACKRPMYCDTDSIMCEGLPESEGVTIGKELGQWKPEFAGHKAAIAGRKLYALWGEKSDNPEVNAERIKKWGDATCVKLASKGVRLTADQMLCVAGGGSVMWANDAPTFTRDGRQQWIERKIRMNAESLNRLQELAA